MAKIRRVKKGELGRFNEIVMNAYPGFLREDNKRKEKLLGFIEKMMKEDKRTGLYGYFDNGEMLGTMRILDLKMNYRNHKIKATGIGLVAVDLLHKKKKIARDMLKFYLDYSKRKKANISALYPFRPDFYNKMGYGYGTPMQQYCFKPDQFHFSELKNNTVNLTDEDTRKVLDCYREYQESRHGLFDMEKHEIDGLMKSQKHFKIGYREGKKLTGVMIYRFTAPDSSDSFINDMTIGFYIYNTPDALRGLNGYIYTQADQVNNVNLYLQDEDFFRVMRDIRYQPPEQYHGSTHKISDSGMMIMYRMVDLEDFFRQIKKVRFSALTRTVRFSAIDTFRGDSSVIVQFRDGLPHLTGSRRPDVVIEGSIADLSSVLMGSVSLRTMLTLGNITISNDRYTPEIDNALKTDNRPLCMTAF
ncbi:MAG: GNAT family N-acetyltransferase [bacterium]